MSAALLGLGILSNIRYPAFPCWAVPIPALRACLKRYITNQKEHHRKRSFEEQFIAFLKAHNVDYAPRYVFGSVPSFQGSESSQYSEPSISMLGYPNSGPPGLSSSEDNQAAFYPMFGLDTRVLRIVYTLGVCYLVYVSRRVIFLLVLAIIAAYILMPAVEFATRLLPKKDQARGEALTIVFVLILAVLLTIGGVIGYYAFQQASALAAQVPSMIAPDALQHIQFPKFLRPWNSQIRTVLQSWREAHAKDILETLTSMTMQLLTALGSVLSLLIVLVLSYLLLWNGESYAKGFVSLLPDRYAPTGRSFLHDMNRMLRQWSRAIVLVALGTVVLYGIGFSVLRVPYSILLAMIAFPFEFVPLIGPPVAFGIILMVAFISGYHHLLWLIALFAVVRVIEDYLLQPYFMRGGSIELPPIVVIFGALAGEAIAGVPGLLLSVPAIATIRLLYRYASQDSRRRAP